MPVKKCTSKKKPSARYRVGKGPCVYETKGAAVKANRAVYAKKHGGK